MELTHSKDGSKKLITPIFIYLWIIMFLVEFVKGAMLVTILPVYMGDVLHLTTFAIGLSISMQYIGDNLFRSPSGWLIERAGFRLTMAIGLVIMFAGVALIAFTSQTLWIVLGCALLGMGTAPLWPCIMMGLSANSGENKNFATSMGIIQMSSLGGAGGGPIVINFFVGGSYRPVFLTLLGCMALVIIVSLFLPGRNKTGKLDAKVLHPEGESALMKGGITHILTNLKHTIGEIRKNLNVSWLLYPALFLQSFAIGLLTPVITLFIRTVLHLSPASYSILLIVGGGITVLGLIPIGKLADRHGTKWFLHIGFIMAAISIGCFAVNRSVPILWVLVIMIGISYSFILPTWDTMISHMLPKGEKGAVWGLFLTVQGTGMVFGPMVSGGLWDLFGPTAPFMTSAIVMVILFVIHLQLTRQEAAKLHIQA
ncbi:MFS family permease [Paenibacillus shirakamiensis]|uniref:MFS family permease n=1 Tax=Paenibacillus shirakamiensis TaxID=1265935 RepID=A0ABS4JFE1_9BACL|nr:MFS transporter [Paenibacillus shirakamiensis]MBP1999304.1 MFS family permease [Paenibacillus shirakamiensis]